MRKKEDLNYFRTRPKTEQIDLKSYLKRIDLHQEAPTLRFLKDLHKRHLENIPFENLDVFYRKRILLDVKKIYEKIISGGRGGFCYELNLLFYHLLVGLGYECLLTSASLKTDTGWSDPLDHMIIIVKLENKLWLVDVGYGDLFIYPRLIEEGATQLDYARYFHIDKKEETYILGMSADTVNKKSIYSFRVEHLEVIQFLDRCNYHQESPHSVWAGQKLITQLLPEGRVTLTERTFKLIQAGEKTEIPISNEDEFLVKLHQHFNIDKHQLIFQDAG